MGLRPGIYFERKPHLRQNDDGNEMQPLADDKLKGVDVHCVVVATYRRLLCVVMLVHQAIDGTPVEQVVELGIKQVVDDK